ncbi:4-hydroxy-tetrahydrodipicolinate synthase [Actinomyces minihominis]|uniref:4-hydroxy-tetrahydrodipicolinate synthase n=1 Tax=Actinomyces minihominis TaxID=2002838 RepID=UPI0013EDC7B2|nr:4-hydroxy-tetrahydrodipicolinate synthase [Actinomyces minihominis]
MLFRGSGTALVTPFCDGKIDWQAFERTLSAQIEGGTKALIACGTTGEPTTLSFDEQREVVEFVLKNADGLCVIAGIGGNNTAEVIKAGRVMGDLGVNGLLAVTPYYNKTTQDGLVAHYEAVADAVDRPVILYNVPSRTGLNLEPATVARLSSHERIVALKEANPSMSQILEDFRLFGDTLDIYSGNDDLLYPFLTLGSQGIISVASNLIPSAMSEIIQTFDEGNWSESLQLSQRFAPLIKLLFAQVSPIPVKAAMSRLGLLENELRLPLLPLSNEETQPLFQEIERLGLA